MAIKKINDKIQALLNLADGNTNEHEAQSALLKAKELMMKHKIEMSLVSNHKNNSEEIIEVMLEKPHGIGWKRKLAGAIAENFFCKMFTSRVWAANRKQKQTRKRNTYLFGVTENIAIAKSVYESAVQFIEFNFETYWQRGGKNYEDYYGNLQEYHFSKKAWHKRKLCGRFHNKTK